MKPDTGIEVSRNISSDKCPRLEKETRFAVVMYGGVSLAIYIYGVARELYGMVRATARQIDNEDCYLLSADELSGTEKVYRRLGESLRTRFVIDILSGTSAGGINAIYLAKALANGQSIDGLKEIWLDQGDITKLINDKKSEVAGLGMQAVPSSLLNSRRMYFYLLRALHGMESGGRIPVAGGLSPFVNELDLFITATDLRGLTVSLPVANARARESRFRNVFRFHYSTRDAAGRETETDAEKLYGNDFEKGNNPFLAYVARCTSSFPFAFEPMQLDDIKNVLRMEGFEDYKYKPEKWSAFYKEYEKAGDDFPSRSFGDGGYLDNKPFSYATEALLRRRADQPVDRKLIYIDPSPEHPTSVNPGERPDAFENVMAALLSIPRYEPIREDLEKVVERNQLIQRVNRIINSINLVPVLDKREVKDWQRDPKGWSEKYFDRELLEWFGVSYATYHQLRVASVLEDWKSALLRAFNWSETEEQAENLNALLEGWRHGRYSTDPQLRETHRSENDILFRLDANWRMRRLIFLQNIINRLLKAVYAFHNENADSEEREKAMADAGQIIKASDVTVDIFKLDHETAIKELTEIKSKINDAYGHLRARGRRLRSQSLLVKPQSDEHLQNYVSQLSELKKYLEEPVKNGTRLDDLAGILKSVSADKSGLEEAFNRIEKLSCALSEHLPNPGWKGYICQGLAFVSRKVKEALGRPAKKDEQDNRSPLQKCLAYYHDRFEYYDMLIFPIYYGTGVEETDEVEIVRISPEDGTNLFDERNKGEKKLAGTTLSNFGAFFAREWRQNDMMWGRLDSAECLVKALLGEGQERDKAVEELHRAILQEELTSRDEAAIFKAENETKRIEAEGRVVGKYKYKYTLKDRQAKWLYKAIHRLSKPEKLLERFKSGYSIDRSFPPKETLLTGARAMRVLGGLLNGLSDSHKAFSTPAKWITSVSGIMAGILAVALPNSLGNFLFAGYWVWLLYIFEILLGAAGWLIGSSGLKQLGIASFALTFLSHLLLVLTNKWLSGHPLPKLMRTLVSILVVALVIGAIFLVYFGLLGLGVLNVPDGLLGEWLGRLVQECPKTGAPAVVLFCRPAK
jgi:patatin-related protein